MRRWMGLGAGLLAMLVMTAHASARDGVEVRQGEFHFRRAPVPEWVERREVAAEWPAEAPGASGAAWRNWLIDAQIDRRGGAVRRYFDHALEATSEALVAEAARFTIAFDPSYQSLAIHRVEVRRDGSWSDRYDPAQITLARREAAFESDMSTGDVAALLVVADVRPGDVVRYTYSLTGENPVLDGMTHDELVLSWSDPILERSVRIKFDPGIEVALKVDPGAAEASVERDAHGTEVRWDGRAIAGVPREDETPEWHPAYPRLQAAPRRAWADVLRWARSLYPPAPGLPEDLRQQVAAWRALDEPHARVAAALQLVQDEVRYFSVLLGDSTHRPALPATTWARRYGDCKDKAWLLATLLSELGVDAVPALVSVGSKRGIRDALPAASQFDHVIVRATVGGRTWWLDPTLTQQRGPLATRRAPDYGLALPLADGARGLQVMADDPPVPGRTVVHERFEPQVDGAAITLIIETTYSGSAAEARRRDLQARGPTEVGRRFAEHYRRLHGALEVAVPLTVEDDAKSGELRMRESYLLQKPWESSTPGARIFDLYADAVADLVRLSGTLDRRNPLWRPHPLVVEQRSEFVLLPGWSAHELPEAASAGDDSFLYRREVSRGAHSIAVHQVYESLADQVPAARASSHFEQRRAAANATGARIVVRVPVADAAGERERRLRELMRGIMSREKRDGRRD